jgi:hypothetical protein
MHESSRLKIYEHLLVPPHQEILSFAQLDHDIQKTGIVPTPAWIIDSSVKTEDKRRALLGHRELSLPPELILDTDNLLVCPTIYYGSSHVSTKFSPDSSNQDWGGRSTRYVKDMSLISAPCDLVRRPESGVAKAQLAVGEELIVQTREPEPESAEDVKPDGRCNRRLEDESVVTNEQLRLTGEELRRNLGQSRVLELASHARNLERQLGECQMKLRGAEDARRDSRIKFVEVVGLLSRRRIELESSIAEAQASQFRCSQVTFLSTALQDRVTELEAEVKSLKNAKTNSTPSPTQSWRARVGKNKREFVPWTDPHSFQHIDTGMDAMSMPSRMLKYLRFIRF